MVQGAASRKLVNPGAGNMLSERSAALECLKWFACHCVLWVYLDKVHTVGNIHIPSKDTGKQRIRSCKFRHPFHTSKDPKSRDIIVHTQRCHRAPCRLVDKVSGYIGS